MTGFVTREAQARGFACGAMDPQVGDLAGPLHQMSFQRGKALEGTPRDRVALHVADAALVLALRPGSIRRAGLYLKAPVPGKGMQLRVHHDCLYALQPTIPHLTRSALHRCLQRHGISRLPDVEGDKPKRQKFKRYPIGFFHIDIAEVQTAEGKLYLFVGIDRTSKFAVTQLVEKADRKTAWEFLQHMLEAVPYHVHTILTDNGIQFAEQPRNRNTAYSRQMRFDMICEANGIEHRLTKPNHPWTNGQVERMNRTIKEATVKRYHYDSHDQLRTHLGDFMAAYNYARRLKTLGGLTPYEYICKIWTSEPDRFILNPTHQMPGLNT